MTEEIRSKIKEQTGGYMTAALGLVAGLAWNDAIKSLIEAFFPISKSGVFAKFIYAIVITIVVVFVGQYILKTSSGAQKK
jgi:uncharacterized membrane protein YeaQ/YmgE (transglycosylase-associated protein family)